MKRKNIGKMTDQEFKEKLVQLLKARAEHTGGRIDLSNVDFLKEGVSFDFSKSNLSGKFHEADLSLSELTGSDLYNCFFEGCQFP